MAAPSTSDSATIKVRFSGETQLDELTPRSRERALNHLRTPKPLAALRVPSPFESGTSAVFVGKVRSPDSRCGCGLFGWLKRRRHPAHATEPATRLSDGGGAKSTASTAAATTTTVRVANGSSTAKLKSDSPALKGLARSPFVAGMRSVSREGPGRLVRKITGSRPAAGDAPVAFSLHA